MSSINVFIFGVVTFVTRYLVQSRFLGDRLPPINGPVNLMKRWQDNPFTRSRKRKGGEVAWRVSKPKRAKQENG